MPQLVISAIGPDRPGIVGELTGHLHAASANILESRMVNLRGQFAILLLLEAEAPALASLQKTLPAIAATLGLAISFAAQQARAAATPGVPYRLKTYSMDQPGIVHRVTDVLRLHGVNIEDLQARQESAAFAGTPLFIMEAHITVPTTVPIRTLRGELEAACEQLNCDLDLEPA